MMTNDKTTYTIEFANDISESMEGFVQDCVNPDILTVETESDGTTMTVTVWGDSYAIPLFEETLKERLDHRGHDAEITNADVEIGNGVENSP